MRTIVDDRVRAKTGCIAKAWIQHRMMPKWELDDLEATRVDRNWYKRWRRICGP